MANQPKPTLQNLASEFAQRLASAPAPSKVAPGRGRQIPATAQPRIKKPFAVDESKPSEASLRSESGEAVGPQNLEDVGSQTVPDLQRQAADMLDRLAHPEPAAQGMGGEALAHKVAGKGPKSEMERKRAETRLADQSGKVVAYPQSDERQHRGRKQ